jgi:hypothetical protein
MFPLVGGHYKDNSPSHILRGFTSASCLEFPMERCSHDDGKQSMAGGDPMQPADPGVKLTFDDFVLFPDDGQRHELIDGEHYVTPSPNMRHQQIAGDLHCVPTDVTRAVSTTGVSCLENQVRC